VAVLSVPFPFQVFTEGPANRIVTAFPFVWLPTVVVSFALFLHAVSLRLAWHDLRAGRVQASLALPRMQYGK
jgi:hypothetical protein